MMSFLRIVNFVYVIILALWVSDIFGLIETKLQFLKTFLFFGIPFISVIVTLLNLMIASSIKTKLIGLVAPFSFVVIFGFVLTQTSILNYMLFSASTWQTHYIEFESKNNPDIRIERQKKNVGGRGYRDRYVIATYYTTWFMTTEYYDPEVELAQNWKKVDRLVDDLGIFEKSP